MRLRLLILAALLLSPALHARTIAGLEFPEQIKVDERELVLNGVGLRLATIFNVKVYAAGLYVEKKSGSADELLKRDDAWRLVMKFQRSISEEKLTDAIAKSFEKNGVVGMEKKLAQLSKSFREVKKGETVRITYVPGKGTSVVSGKSAGRTVAGARFAQSLLKGWLGVPPNKELKRGLLGG
jgi:hypothetical protein